MSDFIRICLTTTLGGLSGGGLYVLSLFLSSGEEKDVTWFHERPLFCWSNIFIGAGGSWAILLALLWANRAPTAPTLGDELQLLASCIVAGYAGNKMLPLVAEQLTKEAILKAKRATRASAKSAAQSELTSEVFAYLDSQGNQTSHQTLAYIKRLRNELRVNRKSRKAAILLARLLDEGKHEPQASIEVLEQFINWKVANGEGKDADVADVAWNVANYYEELRRKGGEGDLAYRRKAIDFLALSISILPSYEDDLSKDEDFASLRDDPEAKKLLPLK